MSILSSLNYKVFNVNWFSKQPFNPIDKYIIPPLALGELPTKTPKSMR